MPKLKLTHLVLIALVSCSSYVYANDTPKEFVTILLDGQVDTKVIASDNTTYFPIRLINNSLGYTLTWDASTKSVLLENNQNKISITAGKSNYILNNITHQLPKPIKLIENILYAPQEFFELAFNIKPTHVQNSIELVPSTPEPTTPEELLETPLPPDKETPSTSAEDRVLPLFEGTNTYNVGQKLTIKLAENPSTGYKWQVTFPEGITILEDYFTPSGTNLPGEGGEHTWIIRANAVDTYVIEFKKARPTEPDNVIDTKVFKLKTK
ncbi:protease inhibitor I42 family protein [Niameybacter massiliensis]|uniref:Protease inhibitor I42 family protein n=1 Tax=Holtiella tumoricola TaxID=3018743 RepID=A0AA42DKF7_9FIRM|nr:protease inhibitor I42 family protein [Holtiella tumoricola]MDA3730541.1 protease inhibitor I42 family protein [Holtiella tumoricola]